MGETGAGGGEKKKKKLMYSRISKRAKNEVYHGMSCS